jgi:hypothetical protein
MSLSFRTPIGVECTVDIQFLNRPGSTIFAASQTELTYKWMFNIDNMSQGFRLSPNIVVLMFRFRMVDSLGGGMTWGTSERYDFVDVNGDRFNYVILSQAEGGVKIVTLRDGIERDAFFGNYGGELFDVFIPLIKFRILMKQRQCQLPIPYVICICHYVFR